jgi:hypothetical protein
VRSLEVRSNGTESIQLLQYMDSVRSERGGASLDLQAANLQIAGDTAHGIERQFESREMLAQLMTRTIAETLVRQVFLLLHDTMRREFPDATQIATGGGFVSFAPGDWRHRDQVDIVAGISKGEREQRRGAIETVLIQQEKLHQAGLGQGILMDLRTYHAALIDWTAAGGIRDSRRYWIDPRSQESLQAQQQAAQSAQQQQAQQAAQQQQFLDAQLQLNRETVVGDLAQKRDELSFKYWDAVLKSSVDEQRIDAQYGTDESEPEAVDINQAEGARRASA